MKGLSGCYYVMPQAFCKIPLSRVRANVSGTNFGGRLKSIIVRKLRIDFNLAASELWWLIRRIKTIREMLARVSLLLCCSVHIVRILQILRNLRILGYFCSSASVFILPAHDAGIRFPFRLHICNRCQSYTSGLVSVHNAPLSNAPRDHLATITYITLMCVILCRVPDER